VIPDDLADRALAVDLGDDYGAGLRTVRDYLTHLLGEVWARNADAEYGFTGNSDWEYDIYEPLHRAGLVPAWEDGWGLDGDDARNAEALVAAAIRRLGQEGQS
jgi:hypothetical protein